MDIVVGAASAFYSAMANGGWLLMCWRQIWLSSTVVVVSLLPSQLADQDALLIGAGSLPATDGK